MLCIGDACGESPPPVWNGNRISMQRPNRRHRIQCRFCMVCQNHLQSSVPSSCKKCNIMASTSPRSLSDNVPRITLKFFQIKDWMAKVLMGASPDPNHWIRTVPMEMPARWGAPVAHAHAAWGAGEGRIRV